MIRLFGLYIYTKKEMITLKDSLVSTTKNNFERLGRKLTVAQVSSIDYNFTKALKIITNSQNNKHV